MYKRNHMVWSALPTVPVATIYHRPTCNPEVCRPMLW